MENIKVVAVVVTYNRKNLLLECVDAILSQTYPADKIFIIDNASTDGTEEILYEREIIGREVVDYRKQDTNLGGAGGFYVGLDLAENTEADWVWIMDDDTIPGHDALEKLICHADCHPDASFFASCVHGEQDEPMNVTAVNTKPTSNGYSYWYKYLNEYLVEISTATFVSLLINRNAIVRCGLPCRDFFLWGDDTEYTRRLTSFFGKAYLAGDSWICHKRKGAKTLSIKNESEIKRIDTYYYFYRNSLVYHRIYDGMRRFVRFIINDERLALSVLLHGKNRLKKFRIVQKAVFGAVFKWRKFNKYIRCQIDRLK